MNALHQYDETITEGVPGQTDRGAVRVEEWAYLGLRGTDGGREASTSCRRRHTIRLAGQGRRTSRGTS
jgi:hypothetical protein